MQTKEEYKGQKPLDMKELCEIELGLLKKFDKFAQENGLRYWVMWGTLLGAVRHQGFIPWDDDIDISMPQKDYLRLIELMKENPERIEGTRLNSFEIDEGYTRPFAKLCDTRTVLFEDFDISFVEEGVYIDIFPMLPLPDNPRSRQALRKRWRANFVMLGLSKGRLVKVKNPLVTLTKRVLRIFARATGYKFFLRNICRDVTSPIFEFEEVEYCIGVDESDTQFRTEWFQDLNRLQFEDTLVPAPAGWDAVLRTCYGDYGKLPPLEERTGHPSLAYWRKLCRSASADC